MLIGLHLSYLVINIVEFPLKDSDHDQAQDIRNLSLLTIEIKVNVIIKWLPVLITNALEIIFESQKETSNWQE